MYFPPQLPLTSPAFHDTIQYASRRNIFATGSYRKDKQTGLYYYGARYLDPKYSMWISTDPALSDYIPAAGKATTDEASNLPGMGGLFNHVNHNLYHYAGNNPVKYTDPDGRVFIPPQVIFAGIGFLIGTGTSIIDQYFSNGKNLSDIDYKEVFIDGLSGAASAFLASTGVGLGGQIIGNASFGYLSEYAKQITNSETQIDGYDLLAATITGCIAGMVGGAGNKQLSKQTERLSKRILNAIKHDDYKEIGKAIKYFNKNTKALTKETVKDMFKSILPDKIRDDVINEIWEGIEE